jgi:hypothetical protein
VHFPLVVFLLFSNSPDAIVLFLGFFNFGGGGRVFAALFLLVCESGRDSSDSNSDPALTLSSLSF